MLGNFSEEAQMILNNAKEEMKDLKHPYVGTEHLVLAILKEKNIISKRFFEGRTQIEIAAEIGISQAQVSRLEKNAISHIKRLYK